MTRSVGADEVNASADVVWRFHRAVTRALDDMDEVYRSNDRPPGQNRLLCEIGPVATDIRALRTRLDVDSGYLSRLLRGLEREGLIVVFPSTADRRVRTVRLTGHGLREREQLERAAAHLVQSMFGALTENQRQRLLEAMGEINDLLDVAGDR